MVALNPVQSGVGTAAPRTMTQRWGGGTALAALVVLVQVVSLTVLAIVWAGPTALPLVLVAAALMAMAGAGVLGRHLGLSALDQFPKVFAAFATAAGLLAVPLNAAGHRAPAGEILEFAPFAALASWLALAATYAVGRAMRRRGWFLDRAVVVGSGDVAERLEYDLVARPEYGLELVGTATGNHLDSPASNVLGRPHELLALCQEHNLHVVVVAHSLEDDVALQGPIRSALLAGKRVLVVPRFHGDLHRLQAGHGVRDVPLQELPRPRAGLVRRFVKRSIDVMVAGTALLLLSPLMVLCAGLARRETGGVLFRQVRVGRDGRPIEILKFQTLKPATAAEGDTTWNISHDDRLGPVGSFMRKTSIDELPQLWNIVRGDMSLVGPRPERPFFVDEFTQTIPGYADRHRVQVGLTGWAQVHRLRGDSSIEDRIRYDNAYVASWSPWEDLKIILRTIPEVFRKSGG